MRRGRLRAESCNSRRGGLVVNARSRTAAVLGFVAVHSVGSDWLAPIAWLGIRAGRLACRGRDSGIVCVSRVRQRAGGTRLAGSCLLDRRNRPVGLQRVRPARCDGVGGRGLAGAGLPSGADVPSGAGAGAIGSDVPTGRGYSGRRDGLRRLAVGDHGLGGGRRWENHRMRLDPRDRAAGRCPTGSSVLAQDGRRVARQRRDEPVVDDCGDTQDPPTDQRNAGSDSRFGGAGVGWQRRSGPASVAGGDTAQAGICAYPCDQGVGGRSGTGLTTMASSQFVHFGSPSASTPPHLR